MAARLNPQQDARTRDLIRTTQLVKRLEGFALRENDPQTDKPVKMTPGQVKAAIALLKKTMPDLQNIEGGLDVRVSKHEEAIKELE